MLNGPSDHAPDSHMWDAEYSDSDMDAMYSAHVDDEEWRQTHCPCGGELRATESGHVVCRQCSAVVKTFARETWPMDGAA